MSIDLVCALKSVCMGHISIHMSNLIPENDWWPKKLNILNTSNSRMILNQNYDNDKYGYYRSFLNIYNLGHIKTSSAKHQILIIYIIYLIKNNNNP